MSKSLFKLFGFVVISQAFCGGLAGQASVTVPEGRPLLTIHYSDGVSGNRGLGEGISGLKAWPNPFIEAMNFSLFIEEASEISIGVYNLLGHEVQRIHKGYLAPGIHRYTWDGKDRSGKTVGYGMYYVILTSGKDRQVLKILKSR
jgi:hypothetical protein